MNPDNIKSADGMTKTELLEYVDKIHSWIKSDSVYTLLRYGTKNPSHSGVNECLDDNYSDLYNLSGYLRNIDQMKKH